MRDIQPLFEALAAEAFTKRRHSVRSATLPDAIILQSVKPDLEESISVVVVNYERCALLRACLASLAAQRDVEFEVIVVDNGSRDGSAGMVEREFVPRRTPQVTLIRNSGNRGFCAANNQGFSAARGRFVAVLNNDAEAEPGWLSALVSAFRGRPRVGMAASKILVHEDPRRIDKVGHLIYPDGQNRGRGSGEIDNGQYDRLEEALWPDGCAAMYRREMLEEIGGFDEDFFAYADDADLGLRGRIAGWSCLYVPAAVVRHHRGSTLGVGSGRRVELIERNRILLAVKLFPASLLWLNPWYYAVRVAAGLWAGIRNRGETRRFPGMRGKLLLGASVIKGCLSALPLLPKMLRKRRELRRLRKLTPGQVRALIQEYRIPLKTLMEQAT